MANKPIIGTVTVNGTAKTLSGAPVNIGGVWKTVVKSYECINGVWKPSWKAGYTWKKYNTVTTTSNGWAWGSNITITGAGTVSVTNDTNTALLTPTYGSGTLTKLAWSGSYWLNPDYYNTNFYLNHSYNFVENGKIKQPNIIVFRGSSGWSCNNHTIAYETMHYYVNSFSGSQGASSLTLSCKPAIYSGKTTYSQGSYIADVTAETADAYPTNGRHSDGFWYVKQS